MKSKKIKKKTNKSDISNKSEKGGKSARYPAKKENNLKKIKAIVLLCISAFFITYMFFSGSATVSFFALIIGIVCGLVGVLLLK